jgi:hypothetical protein
MFHKPHVEFEDYNSMMPLWHLLNQNNPQTLHLLALYSAIGQARHTSPALRSPNWSYLHLRHGGSADRIFAVGKFEKPTADPASSDVVFAFVNLSPDQPGATPPGNGFDVNPDNRNLFGIRSDHKYNVWNIAALDSSQRRKCLWTTDVPGSTLLADGISVQLNRVPADDSGWTSAPYQPEYLKLIDDSAGDKCGAP